MAQNRKPPAFQEYAAALLANKNFRLMSLDERGLLMTMRFECWENLNVPSSKAELANYLGFNEMNLPLTERVLSFFTDYGTSLICQELEDYRQHIKEQREKQSKGGKKSAAITNAKWEKAESSNSTGNSTGNSQVTRESLVKYNPEQSRRVS